MATTNWDEKSSVDDVGKKVIKGILTAAIILFLIIGFFSVFYTIESGQEGVLLTFGKAGAVPSQPGLHMKWPFVQQVIKFDMRTQALGQSALQGGDAGGGSLESASSRDLQIVSVKLVVNYRLMGGKSAEIFSNIGAGYEDTVIRPAVHEATKAAIAQFNAQDLITSREQVRSDIQNLLQSKMKQFNIDIQSVSITAFDFSKLFNDAIESKVTAEQLKFKADNDLKRIEVEAAQVAAQAKGQRDAQVAIAQGQSEATVLNARAEAERVKLVQEQLRQSPQYVSYLLAQKWSGQLPNNYLGAGGVIPFLNVPMNAGATAIGAVNATA